MRDPPSARPPGPKRSPSAPPGPRVRSVSPVSHPFSFYERVDYKSSSIIDSESDASDHPQSHHYEPGPPGLQHQRQQQQQHRDHDASSFWNGPYPIPTARPLPGCHCGHPDDAYCRGCADVQQCCMCYKLPYHDCQALTHRLTGTFVRTSVFTAKQPATRHRGGQPSPTPTGDGNGSKDDDPFRGGPPGQSPSRDPFTGMPLPTTLPPTPEAEYSASLQRAWASPIPTSQPLADIEVPLHALPQSAALPVTRPKAFRNLDLEKTPRSPRPPPSTRHELYPKSLADKRTQERRFSETS